MEVVAEENREPTRPRAMRSPRQAATTNAALGPLLTTLRGPASRAGGQDPAGGAPGEAARAALGGAGFVGDDGAPVPGTDVIAACDAIVPSMVERDPEWADWCSVPVKVNDLAAMGASPVGLLDAVGARDTAHAARILAGLGRAARAYGVPVLGGHTHLGVPAALSVTALGLTDHPVPGGGGRPGQAVRLTADLGGDCPVPDDGLPSLLAAADAFAFPSVKEGFGLAAMEALAAGVPLVLRDLPVLREVFGPAARFSATAEALAEVRFPPRPCLRRDGGRDRDPYPPRPHPPPLA
ncbi:AIR synthase related protein [Streptomyces sp. NPDC005393]|uniref:AIR synthase related protein n=1 Tax=Streptomyces sp. NPDC005393 TaxID=3157041 RepID=UPI0033BB55EF